MAKKYIIRKKEKIKSGIDKLRLQYETNLLESKIAFQTKLSHLKEHEKDLTSSERRT